MNYMIDKIKLLPNCKEIFKTAEKVTNEINNNKNLNSSEKILVIELAVAKLNNILYNVSGD